MSLIRFQRVNALASSTLRQSRALTSAAAPESNSRYQLLTSVRTEFCCKLLWIFSPPLLGCMHLHPDTYAFSRHLARFTPTTANADFHRAVEFMFLCAKPVD